MLRLGPMGDAGGCETGSPHLPPQASIWARPSGQAGTNGGDWALAGPGQLMGSSAFQCEAGTHRVLAQA